jgi:hypothetical protein
MQQDSPFTDSELSKNIEKSAENIGLQNIKGPEATASQPVFTASKNCKVCWGQGIVTANLNGPDGAFSRVGTIYCKCVRKS